MPWSTTSPMWRVSAEDILKMLQHDYTPRAEDLRLQADTLLTEIHRWQHRPPTDDERKAVIARVMTLYRETHEYISSRKKQP